MFKRLIKHFHILQMDLPEQFDLISIYSKLLHRHFLGDTGESQLASSPSDSSPTRVSTGKSSTITDDQSTTTTTTTNIEFKEKLTQQTLKRLEHLRSIIERIVGATVELNDRMRQMFQINRQRIHYIFSMKQISQLFRNLCLSLTPDCSIDELLYLWHHECDWTYGKRLIDQIDHQRYRQLYRTLVKKYFTNMINEQYALTIENQLFSNLQVTESGLMSLFLIKKKSRSCNFRNGRSTINSRCSKLFNRQLFIGY